MAAPVDGLITLYAESHWFFNVGVTVIKIRACGGRGYIVVSKKSYRNASSCLQQLVKGHVKFMEYNVVYPELEAEHGIFLPLDCERYFQIEVESLVSTTSSTSTHDFIYKVGEYKKMCHLLRH